MAEPDAASESVLLAGRYRLGAALGRGGMSTVFRAWDERLERPVAVKVFGPDGSAATDRERRLREARVLAGASHPHLVTLFDAVWPDPVDDPRPAFLVMELIEGESLRRRLDRFGSDPALMVRVARELGAALDYLHNRGIVHRDIKPENILIEDATGSVKLVDFGIAQLSGSERLTTAGLVMGTAAYLSPEQVSGATVGQATDVYSLGLVLLECLTGHREYPGSAAEASVARLGRDPVLPTSLATGWRDLLTSMTSRDPGERPTGARVTASVDALVAHGELPVVDDTAVLTAAPTLPMRSAPDAATLRMPSEPSGLTEAMPGNGGRRIRRWVIALTVLLLAAGIAGTAAVWTSLNAQPRRAAPVPTVVITEHPTPTPSTEHGKSDHDHGHGNGNGDKGNGNDQGGD